MSGKVDCTSDLRVAFRASVPVTMTHRPMQYDRLWSDQPEPPPPVAHEYTDPPDPCYRVWPPRGRDAEDAQASRIKQALFVVGDAVQLDPVRCRFTYTRCTLVGTVLLRNDERSRSHRWTGYSCRPLGAMDAASTVLLMLRWALRTVYEIRDGLAHPLDDLPLPGLSITLREVK